MNSTHGGTTKAIAERATVIYDEKTGAIKHVHRTIILEGGVMPSETAMEKGNGNRIKTNLPARLEGHSR